MTDNKKNVRPIKKNVKQHGQSKLPTQQKRPHVVREKSKRGKNYFEPDFTRHYSQQNSKASYILDKAELARNFYWCDEIDFYRMLPPVREILAFVNHEYDTGDILHDVPHFLPRLWAAQRAGRTYIKYRIALKSQKFMDE